MFTLRRALFAALSILSLGFSGVALAGDPRLAVVDVEAAMNATEHWKKLVGTLEKERSEKQAALELKQKTLRDRKEKIDAQKAVSDPATLAPQEEALFREAQELTQGFMKTQQALSEKEKKLTDSMLKRIEAIVRDLALEGDFDFVFEKGPKETPNVLFAKSAIDITPRVIEEYKKRFKDLPDIN